MTEITHRTVKANGINIHLAEAGEGPLVLMLHGFPELWYSWRHQLPALAEAGYHAVASDVRGYGGSDAPHEIEAYSMKNLIADAVGILDAVGEETAVIVGHDWGAPMAWNAAVLHPDRFRAVVGLSVPFVRRAPIPPTQLLKQMFSDKFYYILYYQEPGIAEAEFEPDVRHSMEMFMYASSGEALGDPAFLATLLSNKPKDSRLFDGVPPPATLPSWLTEEDLDYYSGQFQKTGFRGGLNRYRCIDLDWQQMPELAEATVTQPALFIAGEYEGVRRERRDLIALTDPEMMKPFVPNLRKSVILRGCGHWAQQERPREVNAEVISFLNDLS